MYFKVGQRIACPPTANCRVPRFPNACCNCKYLYQGNGPRPNYNACLIERPVRDFEYDDYFDSVSELFF